MATEYAFSPKEFKVLILDQATFGTEIDGAGMLQLDVDNISMPSLNSFQSLENRGGSKRTLEEKDFFQQNKLTVKEVTFTGRMHFDDAHKLALLNVSHRGTNVQNHSIGFATGMVMDVNDRLIDGQGLSDHEAFTIVFSAPHDNVTQAKQIMLKDCLCTNFQLSADTDTDGGLYKYSATFQTGTNAIELNNQVDVSNETAYSQQTLVSMGGICGVSDTTDGSDGTGVKVFGANAVLKSFSLNIDYPVVYTGAGINGFVSANRGQECSITFDAQVKYDDTTDELLHNFDTQTGTTSSSVLDGITSNIQQFAGTITDYIGTGNNNWVDDTADSSQQTALTQYSGTEYALSGGKSGKVDLLDTLGYLSFKKTDYTIGTRYRAVAWVKDGASAITSLQMFASETIRSVTIKGSWVSINAQSNSGISGTGWQMLEVEFTATAETMYVNIQVGGNATGDFYIDNFKIKESGEGLLIQNNSGATISVNESVITNVSMSEGDIMMLDVSGKAVDNSDWDVMARVGFANDI